MKKLVCALALVGVSLAACAQKPDAKAPAEPKKTDSMNEQQLATATLGAGCFWCVEAIFQELEGVESVVSGYAGGNVKNPSYKEVCNGTTGHAEVIQVKFDPGRISYEDLLHVFFTTHDPTTLNRQGADVGTQYRSVIFYHDDAQKATALQVKQEFAPTLWDKPIVTEVSPVKSFFPAENYHQNYFNDNPNAPYCQIVINPKVIKFRQKFAERLKKTE
jgi:peptide-methionine (S)-S-oxide reductase